MRTLGMFTEPGLSPVVARLFPPKVVAIAVAHNGHIWPLDAEEAASVKQAGSKRRADFSAGRACAKKALRLLGVDQFVLTNDKQRCPRWPPGMTGSITHTEGFCAAVAARTSEVLSLGVDAEHIENVRPELEALLLSSAEQERIGKQCEMDRQMLLAVTFAAKEALYKCQFPQSRTWLDFRDVDVEISWTSRHWVVKSNTVTNQSLKNIRGRFAIDEGIVVASAFLI